MEDKVYTVEINRKTMRTVSDMPKAEQQLFKLLVDELKLKGAIRKDWPNFSDLGKDDYHCHLSRKWVACWRWEKGSILIEVYYAGSREKAPYRHKGRHS